MLVGILAAAVIALGAMLAIVLATRGGSSSAGGNTTNGTVFDVKLASSAEVPKSVSTTSSGTAKVTIDGTKVCWSFQLTSVANPSAAHIHHVGSSVSGPVVVPLGGSFKPSGCTTSTSAVVSAVLAQRAASYVNVHSVSYPDGAVRGQLVGSGGGPSGSKLHVVGLSGIVPNGIFKDCGIRAKPAPGAVQTADCAPAANTGTFYPDHLELSTFASTPALGTMLAWAPTSAGATTRPGAERACGFTPACHPSPVGDASVTSTATSP